VNAIRVQRGNVHRATDALLTDSEIPRRIRRSPLAWLLGAGVAGILAGRLVLPPLVRTGRRQLPRSLRLALNERLRGVLTGAVVAALGRFASGSHGDAAAGETPSQGSNGGPGASDPHLSTSQPTS